jgi:hypothetical protein
MAFAARGRGESCRLPWCRARAVGVGQCMFTQRRKWEAGVEACFCVCARRNDCAERNSRTWRPPPVPAHVDYDKYRA